VVDCCEDTQIVTKRPFLGAGEVFDDLERHRCTGRIAREVDIAAEEAHDGVTLDME
jgi:hypothetical protein